MKGVLVVKGAANRLVSRACTWHRRQARPPVEGADARMNTLVFIGKHLDRAALTEGFKSCLT